MLYSAMVMDSRVLAGTDWSLMTPKRLDIDANGAVTLVDQDGWRVYWVARRVTLCISNLGLGRFNIKFSGADRHSQSPAKQMQPTRLSDMTDKRPSSGAQTTSRRLGCTGRGQHPMVRTMALSDLYDKRDKSSSPEYGPRLVPRAGSYEPDIAVRGLHGEIRTTVGIECEDYPGQGVTRHSLSRKRE